MSALVSFQPNCRELIEELSFMVPWRIWGMTGRVKCNLLLLWSPPLQAQSESCPRLIFFSSLSGGTLAPVGPFTHSRLGCCYHDAEPWEETSATNHLDTPVKSEGLPHLLRATDFHGGNFLHGIFTSFSFISIYFIQGFGYWLFFLSVGNKRPPFS